MAELVWDKVGDRVYESGLDKGVLYLPDGSAVPWNGLTSVVENFNTDSAPVYYDGMKISDLITLGEFSADMKAFTYPEEFVEIEGLGSLRHGFFVADQKPQTFGLCYRTQIGNVADGDAVGYKIHILYNVTAIPNNKTYETISDKTIPFEFQWKITAVPEEVPGFRPTAHIIIDTREVDPLLLEVIERDLYGTTFSVASLIPMPDLVEYLTDWFRVRIVDNRDGTWSAITILDGFIEFGLDGLFDLIHVRAAYLDEDTFIIEDTIDASDVPLIRILDLGNGTWTASEDQDGLITVDVDGFFQIEDADANYVEEDVYIISNTI